MIFQMFLKKLLKNLDENGMIRVGAEINAGDISDWKNHTKG